jgi:hypothetical protein
VVVGDGTAERSVGEAASEVGEEVDIVRSAVDYALEIGDE